MTEVGFSDSTMISEVIQMTRSTNNRTYRICCVGLMIAVTFVANYIQIPFLASRIHIGNAFCVLSGMLLGPVLGFLTAGLGNGLFDLMNGWAVECWVTFITKGCIALVSALVIGRALHGSKLEKKDQLRLWLAAAAGALVYVVLYLMKCWLIDPILYAFPREQIGLIIAGKLIPSLLNAAFAILAAPILMNALYIPLHRLGILKRN